MVAPHFCLLPKYVLNSEYKPYFGNTFKYRYVIHLKIFFSPLQCNNELSCLTNDLFLKEMVNYRHDIYVVYVISIKTSVVAINLQTISSTLSSLLPLIKPLRAARMAACQLGRYFSLFKWKDFLKIT